MLLVQVPVELCKSSVWALGLFYFLICLLLWEWAHSIFTLEAVKGNQTFVCFFVFILYCIVLPSVL